ncbi:MAG: serine hydrolase, partial [Pseudomonadota bacterium]
MRLFWTIAKGFGLVLAIAAIGVGAWVALNWTFVRNMATGADVGVTDVDWYRPLERVEGASDTPPLPRAQAGSISTEALAAAQAYSDEMDGIGLIVFHDGAIQHETYSDDFGPGRRSATFSMHKSVLGLLYMAALADGYVGSLDDRTGDYIEAWSDDPRGDISLRDFLTMSSGLRLYSLAKGEMRAMKLVLSDTVTGTALKNPIERPAGETFSYDNASSQIAGAALQSALERQGLTYAEYLSERLWKPVGASDAFLWVARPGGEPRYFSGFQANLMDWLRVGLLIANKGEAGGDDGCFLRFFAMGAPSSSSPPSSFNIISTITDDASTAPLP